MEKKLRFPRCEGVCVCTALWYNIVEAWGDGVYIPSYGLWFETRVMTN